MNKLKGNMTETLRIAGQDIEVSRRLHKQASLKFFPQNPRIYSIVCSDNKEPSQEEIEERLKRCDHVKKLIQSIEANGGLIDPLIVRDGELVVYEGNSRLAAYRVLAQKNPIKWGEVKCLVLPENIDSNLIFNLLGQYHIIGRTDWAPFEQGGYLWRRFKQHKTTQKQMATEMGLSMAHIKSLISVYGFMIENHDTDAQHWSYYEEYLKSAKIAKRRAEFPKMDEIFVEKVVTGEICRAIDVREKIAKVAETGGQPLRMFLDGTGTIEECYQNADNRGANNLFYKRLLKFREQIAGQEIAKEIDTMPQKQLSQCLFELRKILDRSEKLGERIEERLRRPGS